MKIPILVKWISIIIVIFTSLVLPLTLLETSLSRYGSDALDWAGNNESLISMIVILALMLDVIFPIPNGLTNTLAGASLGWTMGSFVVWIGLNLGSCFGYFIGRFAARPFAKKIINKSDLNQAQATLSKFNIITLIISRPVPAFAELVTISAGLSKMPFRIFLAVVSIINIGVAAIFTAIGAAAINNNSASLALLGVAVLPALFYFLYIKLKK